MIWALLAACAPPASLWPTDACRVGETLAPTGEVRCGAGEPLTFAMAEVTAMGGDRGADWVGLSWWARGPGLDGGEVSVGWRPGELGVSVADAVAVGFAPEGGATVVDAVDGCDLATEGGEASLAGLPAGWTDDGGWSATWPGPEAAAVTESWDAPWASTCALDPKAWSTVRLVSTCDDVPRAEVQLVAPDRWSVTLDALGQVATMDAAWSTSFDAACDGADAPAQGATLTGDGADTTFATPLLSVARHGDGDWFVTSTTCGTCADWVVSVEGLPDP